MTSNGPRRVAAIDIGTNTVRLLIADVERAGGVYWIERHAIVSRLGQGVDASGTLQVDAVARTTEVLEQYRAAIESHEDVSVAAIATSAVRDAANREDFLIAAEGALGVRPRVITGDEEATIAFAGATTGLDGAGPHLVIDPGGGSTEFVLGRGSPMYAKSVDIGSVRLTERMLASQPLRPAELAAARAFVAALVQEQVELPVVPQSVRGVAGTFTSLAALDLDLPTYDSERVHGTRLTLDDLHDLADRLATMTIEQIAAIPSMDPARAPVITGGAIVAEQSVRHTGLPDVTVSEHDSLDGLALRIAADLRR